MHLRSILQILLVDVELAFLRMALGRESEKEEGSTREERRRDGPE
jgi:hypothetical protein